MSQPRLIVPTTIVRGLVQDFIKSRKGYCSSFKPFELGWEFHTLPEAVPGYIDYHQASRVLDNFVCHKMTGHCNTWTDWMRARLRKWKERETSLTPKKRGFGPGVE